MSYLTIDADLCTRDGHCAGSCPLGLIELRADAALPALVEDGAERCIVCGHCVAVCPTAALSIEPMAAADCPPLDPALNVSPAQAEQFLRSRRSIRAFADRSVERETIEHLLDVARFAPTGSNGQRVGYLVYHSRQAVQGLTVQVLDLFRYLVKNNHPAAEKMNLAALVDAYEQGADPVTRHAPALVITYGPADYPLAGVDSAIALSYLDLAAASAGLGACWAGFFMLAAAQWPPLLGALQLPEGQACTGAMMLGYPRYSYHRLPTRNPAPAGWRA
jgi:nitroreductase/NAD-dependent dihydropyrimidine dehydrogenase PreA subunit